MLDITVIIKDGGFKSVKIKPDMIGQLATSIRKQGYEYLTLLSGAITVVGFMVTGTQTGERVIVLGGKEPQAIESNETAQPIGGGRISRLV